MSPDQEQEEIEGLDSNGKPEPGSHYPLDDVMVRNETRTVGEIMKRIANGRYAMNPDFQRDFLWPKDKQSKLIESCVMRIPLPVFYVAEGADGRVTVVDGLQRLSTFRSFLSGELRLQGLGEDHPLEGKFFKTLPINLQERIEDTQLTLYILDKNAPDAARLDIFERVNSGIPLTRQQMRNALYNGPATKWLAEFSEKDVFRKTTGNSLRPKTMRDREAINRFCAFYLLDSSSYTAGDMDEYLARALKHMNRRLFDFQALERHLLLSLNRNAKLFGRHAFRKSLIYGSEDVSRSVINIALFDVLSVAFAQIETSVFTRDSLAIKNAVVQLIKKDSEFNHYITYSTNGTYQVHGRFRKMKEALGRFSK
jgi:hypothetical protein